VLTGPVPASAATVERVTVESFDGVDLGGWLIRPEAPAGAKLPTVLISTPYIGQCVAAGTIGPCWPAPETPADWAEHPEPVELLVNKGYAVAWFSVRGTGVSGGCFEDLGRREQRDQEVLVDWIAAQSWSNDRVGMMGLSYMSQTALAGAAMRPKALKTVVVAGMVTDLYTFMHSPQGLAYSYAVAPTEAAYAGDISLAPPGSFRPNPPLLAGRLQHHHERACPELARTLTEPSKGAVTGDRDAQFWLERRLTPRLRRAHASVLVAQGLRELWSGHAQQEDALWSQLDGEKAMYIGQWGHTYPWQSGHDNAGHAQRADLKSEWFTTLIVWLDHYLKGARKPDILGRVRFEDESKTWHESRSWPPRESRDEVLYLGAERKLAPAAPAAESALPFRSYPQAERTTWKGQFMCPALLDSAQGPGAQTFLTAPVQQRTVIAGNPMAYLDLESDQEGGGFQVLLYDIGPEFDCAQAKPQGEVPGARALTIGGADLRFHHGGFDARPFSSGHVRVDIANLAAVLKPGHRLGVSISYGDPDQFAEVGHTPVIDIGTGPRADSSQLVIPVLEGGFGAAEPAVAYPPRPAGPVAPAGPAGPAAPAAPRVGTGPRRLTLRVAGRGSARKLRVSGRVGRGTRAVRLTVRFRGARIASRIVRPRRSGRFTTVFVLRRLRAGRLHVTAVPRGAGRTLVGSTRLRARR